MGNRFVRRNGIGVMLRMLRFLKYPGQLSRTLKTLGWVFKVRLSWPGYFKNRSIPSITPIPFLRTKRFHGSGCLYRKITLPWCLVSVPNLVQVALIGYEAPSGYMPGTGIRTCHPFSPCPSHVLCVDTPC